MGHDPLRGPGGPVKTIINQVFTCASCPFSEVLTLRLQVYMSGTCPKNMQPMGINGCFHHVDCLPNPEPLEGEERKRG